MDEQAANEMYEDELLGTIESLIKFAWPDISRGPASDEWRNTMHRAMARLGWPQCDICYGSGASQTRRNDICIACYGVGRRDPNDI